MVRLGLIFAVILFMILFCLWKQVSGQPMPELNNIIEEPKIIKHNGSKHMVLNYGGIEMLHPVISKKKAYPQCDVVQMIGNKVNEALVVVGNPKRFALVIGKPIAMRTDHNKQWNEIVRQTFNRGAQ